jgi:hypothetical protein
MIVDDYGYWRGSGEAVDEYIAENKLSIFLNRIDDTSRFVLKHSLGPGRQLNGVVW